jgi:hypothetical protein
MPSRDMFFGTKWRIALLVSLTLLPACGKTGAKTDACAGWKPIVLADQSIDGLTDQDAQEVLTHNVYGQKRGCW